MSSDDGGKAVRHIGLRCPDPNWAGPVALFTDQTLQPSG